MANKNFDTSRLDDYVDVATRIREFAAKYPEGSLQPMDPFVAFQMVQVGDQFFVCYTAAAYRTPDDPKPGIGVAWEPVPGNTPYTKNSELMNAETAAWGRAIVASLAADARRIASREELRDHGADEATLDKLRKQLKAIPALHLVKVKEFWKQRWPKLEELSTAQAREALVFLDGILLAGIPTEQEPADD